MNGLKLEMAFRLDKVNSFAFLNNKDISSVLFSIIFFLYIFLA